MMSKLFCKNEGRRERVRKHKKLNGLDYIEVGKSDEVEPSLASQSVLRVYFLGKAPVELVESNISIEGGRRISNIRIKDVKMCNYNRIELDDYMEVIVDRPGDFSTYTLRVVEQDEQGKWQPHPAFDPRYDRINFNFKVDCPSDLDCKQETVCPPEPLEEPDINYLAKDYTSFRQLILDRLALVMPDWKETHVPDIGIALVEVLAYVGDHLSYYQDAVATEAYLDTARQRISVRRHARLVDYAMHEGCNARAWVCVETDSDIPPLEFDEVYFITGFNETLQVAGRVLTEDDLRQVQSRQYEIFEPMRNSDDINGSSETGDSQKIRFYKDHSRIYFYTWGNKECCLPRGATSATLVGELVTDTQQEIPPCKQDDDPKEDIQQMYDTDSPDTTDLDNQAPRLHLKPGDVLVFEEVIGPETGHPGDADPKHRHAVLLTKVEAGVDPLNCQTVDNQVDDVDRKEVCQPVVEISWAEEDALPFSLCLSSLGPPPECKPLDNVSIACGNVILVDHGQTMDEDLGSVPVGETIECCKEEGVLADTAVIPGYYRPSLQNVPLTFSQQIVPGIPASAMLTQDVRQAMPQVTLSDDPDEGVNSKWKPKRDLLSSGPDDQHFVAEIDNDGRAHLRFGDEELGERPDAGLTFQAIYRVGNGLAGNVGAEAISHMVLRKTRLSGTVINVRNPLPAQGGTAPDPMAEVKLFAPHAFRKELQRAITADDYAAIVQREFKDKVQRAAARLRWTGSWYEMLVAVDPYGKEEAGPELLEAISGRLHRYRRIGHDLVVKSARRVPLDIEILVCVLPNYLRGHVKAALLDLFSNRLLPNGQHGFFHVDNLSFGDDIHLSRLVAIAQAVEGVESIQVKKLQRLNELANSEIENGVLPLGTFEIARLDNDPNFPENGILTLDV
ncbi:MAG: putative baseplate assembly protein, partial [Gammaproteobacteria bacterium]|nr:putative baseplate assembly protein [Gammaproteobacteria bacterium]